jgi:hypothetical protein
MAALCILPAFTPELRRGGPRITWRTRLADDDRQKRAIPLARGDLPHQSLDDLGAPQTTIEIPIMREV